MPSGTRKVHFMTFSWTVVVIVNQTLHFGNLVSLFLFKCFMTFSCSFVTFFFSKLTYPSRLLMIVRLSMNETSRKTLTLCKVISFILIERQMRRLYVSLFTHLQYLASTDQLGWRGLCRFCYNYSPPESSKYSRSICSR